jgi:hypothetical protein
MNMQAVIVIALVALLLAGLVIWALREFRAALAWLTQPAACNLALLDRQDLLQADRELQSR